MLWVIAWSEKNKLVEDNWDAACLQECGELGGRLGKYLLVSGEGARAPDPLEETFAMECCG